MLFVVFLSFLSYPTLSLPLALPRPLHLDFPLLIVFTFGALVAVEEWLQLLQLQLGGAFTWATNESEAPRRHVWRKSR